MTERTVRSFDRLAAAARAATSGEATPEKLDALEGRVLAAAAARRGSARGAAARSRAAMLVAAAAALVAIGAAIAAMVLVARPSRLAVAVGDRALADGEYVRATEATGPQDVRFSEGSRVTVAPGGRARVADVTTHGCTFVLEEGLAHVDVVHAPGAAWTIAAGPYLVRVRGTEFDVSWSQSDERLAVTMQRGTVDVTGPNGAATTLRGGQRLVADAAATRVESVAAPSSAPPSTIAPAPTASAPLRSSATAVEAVSAVAPTPAPAASAVPAHAAASSAAPRTPSASWSERVAAGDYGGVVAAADARGLATTLDTASLSDLAALGDAARFAGRPEMAHRALVAERSRFPGSPQAANAAFLLGRSAEDVDHDSIAALGWYDRYLAEAPNGAFVSDALGRKMLLLRARSRDREAAAAAHEYLARFPDGAYAHAAHDIDTRVRAP